MKALVFAMLALATSAAASPSDDYRHAVTALSMHDDGFGLKGADPDGPSLLRQEYKATQAWAADWLNQHPDRPLADLTTAAANLDNNLDVSAQHLDAHSVLVTAHRYEEGTVFILSSRTGHNRTAWDIADNSPAKAIREGETLAAWAPESAAGDCRAKAGEGRWGICGPLYAGIGILPPMPDGVRRFYVAAGYAQEAGATIGSQFSVWTWDGTHARPILVHGYTVMVDQDGPKVGGGAIRIPAKGFFKQLFACGACVGREMRIDIRLDTPKGAELVGERSLTPELDLIDQLYDRVLANKPVGSIASAQVVRSVRAELKGEQPDLPVGMIMSWRPVKSAGRRVICLSTDNDAGAHLFAFDRDGGRLKIVSVRPTHLECKGPGARS